MIKSVSEWEQKLRDDADKWLNEIAIAILANEGNSVRWDYKNLQDRFRKHAQSHIEILNALQRAFLIKITQDGHSRRFELTDWGWNSLAAKNHQKLCLLIADSKIRKRNQNAIAKRKKRRKVYADPTKQIIDDFRWGVEFSHEELLKQLRRDRDTPCLISRKAIKVNGELRTHAKTPIANIRFQNVIHPLLAFETRKFCALTRNERGRIYHEFSSLDWNYRRFATFNGRPFVRVLGITSFHRTYLRKLSFELYPALYAYGESLGLYLIYEPEVISFFGEPNDAEFQAKFIKVQGFIRKQIAECLTKHAE